MKMLILNRKRVLASLLVFAFLCLISLAADIPIYQQTQFAGKIHDASQIYDGDTLKDVRILVSKGHACTVGEVWPGVFATENGFYIETDIRIAGIDTPEKRPSTKNRDGSPRTKKSRDNEKYAAQASRNALIGLLRRHNFEFKITAPQQGKYAGRTVAHCRVGDIDVSEYLIEKGHALPYDGGTKTHVNWEVLDKGLMR